MPPEDKETVAAEYKGAQCHQESGASTNEKDDFLDALDRPFTNQSMSSIGRRSPCR